MWILTHQDLLILRSQKSKQTLHTIKISVSKYNFFNDNDHYTHSKNEGINFLIFLLDFYITGLVSHCKCPFAIPFVSKAHFQFVLTINCSTVKGKVAE